MRTAPVGSILLPCLLGLANCHWIPQPRRGLGNHPPNDLATSGLHVRYTEVQLPSVHVDDFYLDTGHDFQTSLTTPLLPWTRSPSFRKNGTVWPVISASFTPFSAAEWLTFNSSTYDLYGRAPFSPSSYNVSVTLTPMFVNRTEDVTIPPQANSSTPITFATVSFSVHIVSDGTSDPNLNGWVPYVLIVVSSVAVISFIGIIATCFSQDLCCSWRSSSLDTSNEEKTEATKESELDAEADTGPNQSRRHALISSGWMFSGYGAFRPKSCQLTPYEVMRTPGAVSRRTTLMVKPQPLPFADDQDSHVAQIIFLDATSVQYVNTMVGAFFAVGFDLMIGSPDTALEDMQPSYRVQIAPYSPSWIHFCPRRFVLWGTPMEQLAQGTIVKYSVSLVSNATDFVVGKLSLTVSPPKPSECIDVPFSRIFTGTEKGVWHECINGVDTLSILSGTVYAIKYHPPALSGQQIQPGRYHLKCSQALPSWLALGSSPLEVRGDTTGYKRRDLRDMCVVDRFTERVIAKLRVTLVIAEEWA